MIIGQWSFGCCRLNECGRVDAYAIQVFQSVYQAGHERVLDHVRDLLGEQLCPLLILNDVGC
jgi:hypothetical protein